MHDKMIVEKVEAWAVECTGEVGSRRISGNEGRVGLPSRPIHKGMLEKRLETLNTRRLEGLAAELIELVDELCILSMLLAAGLVGDGIDREDTLNQRLWKLFPLLAERRKQVLEKATFHDCFQHASGNLFDEVTAVLATTFVIGIIVVIVVIIITVIIIIILLVAVAVMIFVVVVVNLCAQGRQTKHKLKTSEPVTEVRVFIGQEPVKDA